MTTTDEIRRRLTVLFREVFDDETIELENGMTANDIDEWDSLSHITLVVSCEKEFGLRLTPREVGNLENVGQLVALLEERGTK